MGKKPGTRASLRPRPNIVKKYFKLFVRDRTLSCSGIVDVLITPPTAMGYHRTLLNASVGFSIGWDSNQLGGDGQGESQADALRMQMTRGDLRAYLGINL